jgi:hypothetical protein
MGLADVAKALEFLAWCVIITCCSAKSFVVFVYQSDRLESKVSREGW